MTLHEALAILEDMQKFTFPDQHEAITRILQEFNDKKEPFPDILFRAVSELTKQEQADLITYLQKHQ